MAGDDRTPARGPDLAVGPDGTIFLVWTVGEDPAADARTYVATEGGVIVVNRRLLGQEDRYIPGVIPETPCWPEPMT